MACRSASGRGSSGSSPRNTAAGPTCTQFASPPTNTDFRSTPCAPPPASICSTHSTSNLPLRTRKMATVTQAARPTKTTRKDYLRCHQLAKESDRNKRLALLEIYEQQLYRHAGYLTWSEYVAAEWSYSERHSYRLLAAARVEADLTRASCSADPSEASDRALAELAKIDPAELRAEIWDEASASGDVTEEKVRDLVAGYLAELEEDDQ